MIFTQVSLEVQVTVKKPNGAEENDTKLHTLPCLKEKLLQSRLDERSMQGLGKVNRYLLDNIGELEDIIFQFFYDEKGTKYTTTMWERDPKTNKMILEGEVANGI